MNISSSIMPKRGECLNAGDVVKLTPDTAYRIIDRLQGASRALFFMLTPIGVKKLTPDTRGCHFVSLGVQNVYPV